VDLAEVVVVVETAAGVGGDGSGSGSDWRASVSRWWWWWWWWCGGGNKTTVAGMGGSRSDAVKKKEKKEKKTSFLIRYVRLHLTAGWVPVDLAEVVAAAVETAVGMGGSRSDWRVLGMGV
jgi:hypothetical protein